MNKLSIVSLATLLILSNVAAAFYSPQSGRFINRDPIEEEGGENLYRFVDNDPVNRWDWLGLTMERRLANGMIGGGGGGPSPLNQLGPADRNMPLMSSPAPRLAPNAPIRTAQPTQPAAPQQTSSSGPRVGSGSQLGTQTGSTPAPVGTGSQPQQPATARPSPAPDFVVTPEGTVHPVPKGATGPTPTQGPGFQYTGGSGGRSFNPRVSGVRFMDQTPQHPSRVVYMNQSGQTVSPTSGRTIPRSDPQAHIPTNTPPSSSGSGATSTSSSAVPPAANSANSSSGSGTNSGSGSIPTNPERED